MVCALCSTQLTGGLRRAANLGRVERLDEAREGRCDRCSVAKALAQPGHPRGGLAPMRRHAHIMRTTADVLCHALARLKHSKREPDRSNEEGVVSERAEFEHVVGGGRSDRESVECLNDRRDDVAVGLRGEPVADQDAVDVQRRDDPASARPRWRAAFFGGRLAAEQKCGVSISGSPSLRLLGVPATPARRSVGDGRPLLMTRRRGSLVHGARPALLPQRYSAVMAPRVGFQVAPADRGLCARRSSPTAGATDSCVSSVAAAAAVGFCASLARLDAVATRSPGGRSGRG